MEYPYLARKTFKDETGTINTYVVMFVEPERGVVLVDKTKSKNIFVGKIGLFDEDEFNALPSNEYVKLKN